MTTDVENLVSTVINGFPAFSGMLIAIWVLMGELKEQRELNKEIYNRLIECYKDSTRKTPM